MYKFYVSALVGVLIVWLDNVHGVTMKIKKNDSLKLTWYYTLKSFSVISASTWGGRSNVWNIMIATYMSILQISLCFSHHTGCKSMYHSLTLTYPSVLLCHNLWNPKDHRFESDCSLSVLYNPTLSTPSEMHSCLPEPSVFLPHKWRQILKVFYSPWISTSSCMSLS